MKTSTPFNPEIGIDLRDLRHAVCVLDSNGGIAEEYRHQKNRQRITKFAKKKAVVATARKLTVVMPGVWKTDSSFIFPDLTRNRMDQNEILKITT